MRKVILGLAVSLDGFIEDAEGSYDWCFRDQNYGLSNFFSRIDTAFFGRKTYEEILSRPDAGTGGFPQLKEYVFSKSLKTVREGVSLISRDIEKEVLKIKKDRGKDIWLFGGSGLTTSLINLNLVDEVSLAVHPILLGGGKPLFTDIKKNHLSLLDIKKYSTGLVSLSYSFKNS